MSRLVSKIRNNADRIMIIEEDPIVKAGAADVTVVAYGISSRVATKAIADATARGVKVGLVRLVTVWPFPEKRIRKLARTTKLMVMPEINCGQMYRELQRAVGDTCRTALVPHCGGWVHDPDMILAAIMDGVK